MSPRQTAIANGDPHYHGRPCRHCQNTLRYTSGGNCVPCSKAGSIRRGRERYRNDPEWRESILARQRDRYHSDPEFRERQKAKTADLSGVEYAEKLLKNRRRDALKRMAERNDRPDT